MSGIPQKPITDPESSTSGNDSTRVPSVPPVSSNSRSQAETNFSGKGNALIADIGWDICLVGGIVTLAVLLRLWHLSALTDNYDEGVYWASLRALHAGDSLFTPVFSSQPPFFLLSMVPLVDVLGPTLVAGRLSIVLFSLLGILAMYALGRRLGGRWVGFGAALLLAVDHLYLIQSQTIQAEAPSTALMIVAVTAASFADRAPWQASLLSGVATTLAILTKLFAVVAIVPILLLFLGQMIQMSKRKQAPWLHWGLRVIGCYLLGFLATGALLLLPHLGHLQQLYAQVIAFHLDAARAFPSSLSENFSLIIHTQAEYPLLVIALAGVVIGLLRKQWNMLIAVSWVLAALVVLLQQAPLFDHHLVLLVPGLALTASLGLAPRDNAMQTSVEYLEYPHFRLPTFLRIFSPSMSAKSVLILRVGLPILLLCGVVAFALHTNLRYPLGIPAAQVATLTAAANDLKTLTTPDQLVIADDQYVADMAERSVPPELVDTSFVRIQTGYLTTAQVIALAEQPQVGAILFYTGRFDQLSGFRAWVEGHFHLAREYGDGRALYLPGAP
ncbi:MAG TPA: glycosyltransferase family 39 protein [Ktedonobacterales bacterium]|jgi:4-amino-4-deoxy-L-arabinose transferase-like glycosyltransferase